MRERKQSQKSRSYSSARSLNSGYLDRAAEGSVIDWSLVVAEKVGRNEPRDREAVVPKQTPSGGKLGWSWSHVKKLRCLLSRQDIKISTHLVSRRECVCTTL